MLVAIEIGNSTIGVGVFEMADLRATWRLTSDTRRTPDEYGLLLRGLLSTLDAGQAVTGACAISGVVPRLEPVLRQAVVRFLGVEPFIVSRQCSLGLMLRGTLRAQTGIDRILGALGGTLAYGAPLLVLDLGTATTVNAVSRDREFLGGAIAPGVSTALHALHTGTAQLPLTELVRPPRAIGVDTVSAIQAGIFFGYLGLAEELIRRAWDELGHCRVVATGGHAQLFAAESTLIDQVDADLTLRGLREAWRLNAGS
ncbi:MAG: type III pantothenate kinase [Chloroflexi bacterium]|nr:type III pantothenate kinase [Chloroflexota bacterium]